MGIPVKPWELERLVEVKKREDGKLEISGKDEMLNPYSLFKKVTLKYSKVSKSSASEPFVFPLKMEKCKITLEFQGHYDEKSLSFDFNPIE